MQWYYFSGKFYYTNLYDNHCNVAQHYNSGLHLMFKSCDKMSTNRNQMTEMTKRVLNDKWL